MSMNTLGNLLKKSRERKRLTIEDISKSTKIGAKYLKALENDDYSQFADITHSKGFLKIYSTFLELNTDEVLALWRRDFSMQFKSTRLANPVFNKSPKRLNDFVFTPYTIVITLVLSCIFIFFAYLFFQYRGYVDVPTLEISSPANNAVLQDSVLRVEGKTDLETEVFVNNQKIDVSPDGTFSTVLKVRDGLNSISITAKNKLNRVSEKILNVVYSPPPPLMPYKPTSEVPEATPSIDVSNVDEDLHQ